MNPRSLLSLALTAVSFGLFSSTTVKAQDLTLSENSSGSTFEVVGGDVYFNNNLLLDLEYTSGGNLDPYDPGSSGSYSLGDIIFYAGTAVNPFSVNTSILNLELGGTVTLNQNQTQNNVRINVNNGGTLINNGQILGSQTTTVNSGGTLGGNGGAFSNVQINGGSFLNWNVNSFTGTAGANWDSLTIQNLDLLNLDPSTPLTINIIGSSGIGNGGSEYVFDITSVTGDLLGFNPNNITFNTASLSLDSSVQGGSWSIYRTSQDGVATSLVLDYSYLQAPSAASGTGVQSLVLPEPSTYALFGIGAIGMLMLMRRENS